MYMLHCQLFLRRLLYQAPWFLRSRDDGVAGGVLREQLPLANLDWDSLFSGNLQTPEEAEAPSLCLCREEERVGLSQSRLFRAFSANTARQ